MSIAIELTRALPTAAEDDEGHLAVDAVGVGVFADRSTAATCPRGSTAASSTAQGFTAKPGSTCVVPGPDGRILVALGLGPSAEVERPDLPEGGGRAGPGRAAPDAPGHRRARRRARGARPPGRGPGGRRGRPARRVPLHGAQVRPRAQPHRVADRGRQGRQPGAGRARAGAGPSARPCGWPATSSTSPAARSRPSAFADAGRGAGRPQGLRRRGARPRRHRGREARRPAGREPRLDRGAPLREAVVGAARQGAWHRGARRQGHHVRLGRPVAQAHRLDDRDEGRHGRRRRRARHVHGARRRAAARCGCAATCPSPTTCPGATPPGWATCCASATAPRSRCSTPTPRAGWCSPTRWRWPPRTSPTPSSTSPRSPARAWWRSARRSPG